MTRDPAKLIREIQAAVAAFYNVPLNAITGKSRAQRVAWARHVSMALLMDYSGCSREEIAKYFDRESSVPSYARKRINEAVDMHPWAARDMAELRALAERAADNSRLRPCLNA